MANYRIEDIEGIGEVYGQKFRELGIKDTDSLLDNVGSRGQRQALAEKTGISTKLILRFANMADLYRISGIGQEFSELLEAAGVDTVPELAQRDPVNLYNKMREVNEVKKLTRRTPTEAEVTGWVAEAKTLPRVLKY